MATMNISLPNEMKIFVENRSRAEGFGTVSEYLRSIIRQIQKQHAKKDLEELLLEGIRSPSVRDTDKFWSDLETNAIEPPAKRR